MTDFLLTEFEELALKKITKDYLIDCFYTRLNAILVRYSISNAEISKKIGWDPAGFNQKYNRNNDLRITTFIKIYVALVDIIAEKEAELGLEELGLSQVQLDDLITKDEFAVGALFNHISAAAEQKTDFLNSESLVSTYKQMKSFVFVGKKNKKYSDREISVYIHYYKIISEKE